MCVAVSEPWVWLWCRVESMPRGEWSISSSRGDSSVGVVIVEDEKWISLVSHTSGTKGLLPLIVG